MNVTTPNKVSSGLLSDAMDALGIRSNVTGSFTLSHPEVVAVGRAFTLRQVAVHDLPGGAARHGEAAEKLISEGDILIIDVPDGLDIATWGEGHTLRALGSRAAGVVVNGAVRDVMALGEHPLPVLYRTSSPRRSKSRLVTAEIGCIVEIKGVTISPGDLICFDADGLAAVSRENEAAVLAKAADIRAWEDERDARLKSRLS